jgi:hypothetical protein
VWNGADTVEEVRVLYDYLTDPECGKVDDGIINQVKAKGEAVISSRQLDLSTHSSKEYNSTSTSASGNHHHQNSSSSSASSSSSSSSQSATSALSAYFLYPSKKEPTKFSGFIVGPENVESLQQQQEQIVGSRFSSLRNGAKTMYIGPKSVEHRVIVYQVCATVF